MLYGYRVLLYFSYILSLYLQYCLYFNKAFLYILACMRAYGFHSTMEGRGQLAEIRSHCVGHLAHSPFVLKTQVFNTSSV